MERKDCELILWILNLLDVPCIAFVSVLLCTLISFFFPITTFCSVPSINMESFMLLVLGYKRQQTIIMYSEC